MKVHCYVLKLSRVCPQPALSGIPTTITRAVQVIGHETWQQGVDQAVRMFYESIGIQEDSPAMRGWNLEMHTIAPASYKEQAYKYNSEPA